VEVLKNSLFCDLEIPSCEEKEKEEERKTAKGRQKMKKANRYVEMAMMEKTRTKP